MDLNFCVYILVFIFEMLTRRKTLKICLRHRSDLVIAHRCEDDRKKKKEEVEKNEFHFNRNLNLFVHKRNECREERRKKKNPSFIFWFWENRIVHWVDSRLEWNRAMRFTQLVSLSFVFGWYGWDCTYYGR